MEQIKVTSTDGTEVHLTPTEDGTGAIAIIFAPTEELIQRIIFDLAEEYPVVTFASPKFHDGRWHCTGLVQ